MSNLTSYRQIQMLGARASASTRSTGLGALADPDVQAAASALMDYLQTNGCTQNSFAECSTFQSAANSAGLTPPIKVDGKYGPCTQEALQAVINAGWAATGNSGPPQLAPASCFPGTCVGGKYVPPSGGGGGLQPPSPSPPQPSPPQHSFPPSPPPTQQQATTTTSSNNTALIVVGVVAVAAIGGAALYLRSAKKRR
jgi:hypothetical protein